MYGWRHRAGANSTRARFDSGFFLFFFVLAVRSLSVRVRSS